MKTILKKLLDSLDEIADRHEELFDSNVRQSMSNAIMEGFIRQKKDYQLPSDFGMFSREGNDDIRHAIDEFIAAANKKADELKINTFHGRLDAVQDSSVRSIEGNDYDEFLGHSPSNFFDEAGNVTRTQ